MNIININNININNKYFPILLLILVEIVLGLLFLISPGQLPFLGLMLAGIILLALIRPEWSYFLVILSFSIGGITLFRHQMPGAPGHKTLNPHHFLILLAFIGSMIFIVRQHKRVERTPLDLPILLLFLWASMGTMWSPSFKVSVLQVFRFLIALILFFISFQVITDRHKLRTLIKVWFLLGLVNVVLAFLFPHGLRLAWYYGYASGKNLLAPLGIIKRFEGLSSHPNTLGMLVGLPLILGYGLFLGSLPRKYKLFTFFSLMTMILVLILSFSKGWIIGVFFGTLFFFIKMKKIKPMWTMALCMIFVGSVLIFSSHVRSTLLKRFFQTTEVSMASPVKFGEIINVRAQLWKVGWRFFKESYLIGIGLGGFSPQVGEILPSRADQQLHSLVLSVLFELGAVGILLFLWIMIALIREVVTYSKIIGDYSRRSIFIGWLAGLVALGINVFVRQDLGSVILWAYIALGLLIMKYEYPDKKQLVS